VKPLAGRRILVTRPRELAAGLAALIAGAGGEPVLYPAIEIAEPEDIGPARALLSRAGTFDLALFVSPSAVRKAFALHAGPWPARIGAVGEGTRRELLERGVREVLAPAEGADSEALLALPALQSMHGRRVLIVRGEGGRALLGETLAARGAQVCYAECYRRARPAAAPPAGALDGAGVSSGEALENLLALLGRDRLRGLPLFVAHERIARRARELGLQSPVLAGAHDARMLACMVAYFSGAK
jgi:uroporphyrinogen-III synthase